LQDAPVLALKLEPQITGGYSYPMNSGNHSSTSYHINHANQTLSVSDKLDTTLVIHTELIDSLKKKGCKHCKKLVQNIIEKYGSPSLEATNHHEVSNRDDLIDTLDIRRK
jgi:hypothetical protein